MTKLILAALAAAALAWPLASDAAMCAYMAPQPSLWAQIVALIK